MWVLTLEHTDFESREPLYCLNSKLWLNTLCNWVEIAVQVTTTNSRRITLTMSSHSSSPDTTTIPEQNTTSNETGSGKQGRKKTKSSVLSDEQKKVCTRPSWLVLSLWYVLLCFVTNNCHI